MRNILRQRELVIDEWSYAGEDAAAGASLIVSLGELHAGVTGDHARLGVRLAPAERVEELAALLPQLSLVACEFPSPGEGRGYTQGRLLRERYGFAGELRAVGAGVRQDLVFLLARCGFDALELAPGEDVDAAIRALSRYDVAYQPGAAQVPLRGQRYFAA